MSSNLKKFSFYEVVDKDLSKVKEFAKTIATSFNYIEIDVFYVKNGDKIESVMLASSMDLDNIETTKLDVKIRRLNRDEGFGFIINNLNFDVSHDDMRKFLSNLIENNPDANEKWLNGLPFFVKKRVYIDNYLNMERYLWTGIGDDEIIKKLNLPDINDENNVAITRDGIPTYVDPDFHICKITSSSDGQLSIEDIKLSPLAISYTEILDFVVRMYEYGNKYGRHFKNLDFSSIGFKRTSLQEEKKLEELEPGTYYVTIGDSEEIEKPKSGFAQRFRRLVNRK